jgi:pyrroloquinoline quinone biosynthesis protein B
MDRRSRRWGTLVKARVAGACALLGACATVDPGDLARATQPLPAAPFVVVLGSAQDGGLPQLACRDELCARARREPERRRLVASLLLVDPRSGKRWLVDATPDLPEQVELAERFAPRRRGAGRPALFEGVFLTHAHFGHYSGLGYLGREVYGSASTAVHGSASTAVHGSRRMCAFLASNGPWDLLVEAGHIALQELHPGRAVELALDLRLRPFLVPHRDEYTDTLGFVIEGPERSLVYVPDVDKWPRLEPPIEERIAACDYALLDGSFFDAGELSGRSMAEIPHPFVVESLGRFAPLSAAERAKVHFTPMLHCLFPSGGLWRSPAAPFSLNDQPGRLRSNVTTGDLQRHT